MGDTASLGGERILTERSGHVLIITINRPEARNAFDKRAAEAMTAAIDLLDNTPELFAGVIYGAGGIFSAGADLKAAARGEDTRTDRGGFGIFVRPPKKLLIAAVEGYAVGGGFELCLACDLIVAAKTAQFGLPEVRHNLVAVGGGLFRLPKRIPYHIAMEMALTGVFKPAEDLHKWGLVNRVADHGEALNEALRFADEILVNGPMAVAATKQIISQQYDWTESQAWEEQAKIAAPLRNSEDRAEGLRAFAEKRRPVWKGR
jgi:enoyl-CoA hydratase/carnithine racemase